jgi:hypothetical protein
MRRYYFDVQKDGALLVDEEGIELPNIEAVQLEAAQSLADLAKDFVLDDPMSAAGPGMSVEVRDAAGPVLQAKLAFATSRMH